MNTDPNLLQPSGGNSSAAVAALAKITAPMPNTKVTPVYFYCTQATASMHRPDGKKLPFINHFLKCDIQEDIDYLDKEVDHYQNPYVRRATQEEADNVRMVNDPVGSLRESVRQEVESSFTIEALQALIEKRKVSGANQVHTDKAKIAGVDKAPPPAAGSVLKAAGATSGSGLVAATTASLGGAIKDSNAGK